MIRSLLAGAIDYAGLFPPAGLSMPDAVARYHTYRSGPDAWALGRFVVPAARLAELAQAATGIHAADPRGPLPWRVSALVAGDGVADLETVLEFNERNTAAATGGWAGAIDAVEARADTVAAVDRIAGGRPPAIDLFVEVPVGPAYVPVLEALAAHRIAAKIRAGGVTADQFPSPLDFARFLADCVRLGLPFKATAGLHHPMRSEYPLTYAPGSPRGTMFGFLNVFIASAAARGGAEVIELAQILDERDPAAFHFDDVGVQWRGHAFAVADIEAARARFALSIGSCSFEEPLDDLRTLRLL